MSRIALPGLAVVFAVGDAQSHPPSKELEEYVAIAKAAQKRENSARKALLRLERDLKREQEKQTLTYALALGVLGVCWLLSKAVSNLTKDDLIRSLQEQLETERAIRKQFQGKAEGSGDDLATEYADLKARLTNLERRGVLALKSTSGHEIELKCLLRGADAADRLVRALGPVASDVQQTNHVFDTHDHRLRQHCFSARLRNEDARRFVLTAKAPSSNVTGNVSARDEAEAIIDELTANQILAGARDFIDTLRERQTNPAFADLWRRLDEARAGQPLGEVGRFQNRRRTVVVHPAIALHVEVDQTRFPNGRVDEEVEIELPDRALAGAVEAWLAERAAAVGVETKSSSAKIERFHAALAEVAS